MESEKLEAPYNYEFLVNRVYDNLPNKGIQEKNHEYKLVTPEVTRTLNRKKTQISNFPEVCQHFNRSHDELLKFFTSETKKGGSLTGENKLILEGNYTEKNIQTLLVKYANKYVICSQCKSHRTKLVKKDRLLFLSCSNCLSERSLD